MLRGVPLKVTFQTNSVKFCTKFDIPKLGVGGGVDALSPLSCTCCCPKGNWDTKLFQELMFFSSWSYFLIFSRRGG